MHKKSIFNNLNLFILTILILTLFQSLNLVTANPAPDIYTSTLVDWDISLTGSLDVGGNENSKFSYVNSVLSIDNSFAESQNIASIKVISSERNSHTIAEQYIEINWGEISPPKSINFKFELEAQTYSAFFFDLNKGYLANQDSDYLSLEPPLNVDERLRQISLNLGTGNDLKTLYNILVYLEKNIEITDDNNFKTSVQTFEQKGGNLFSVINLALSMLRVNGIESRYISGLNYESSIFVNTHSWIEVDIQGVGFIPVDILYKQVGYLDLGHIKLYDYPIPYNKIITHSGMKDEILEIDSDDLTVNAKVTNFEGLREKKVKINPKVFSKIIRHNSYNILEVEITNENDYPLILYFNLAERSGLFEIDNPKRYIYLEPNSIRSEWVLFTQNIPEENREGSVVLELKETDPRLRTIRDLISINFTISESGEYLTKDKAQELKDKQVHILDVFPSEDEIRDALEQDLSPEEIDEIIVNNKKVKDEVSIKKYSTYDNKTNTTKMHLEINPKDGGKLYNFSVYENIPKCLAEEIGFENFNDDYVEIINPDPLIVWNFGNIDGPKTVSYEVINHLRDTDCEDSSLTISVAKDIRRSLKILTLFQIYLVVLSFVSFLFLVYYVIRPSD